MFTDQDNNFVQLELHTTRYLGRKDTAENIVDLLFRYDDLYLPESWDTEDRSRLRRSFDRSSLPELIEAWTAKEEWKTLFFARKRPKPIEMLVDMKRFSRAKFNKILAFIHENHVSSVAQQKKLLNLAIEISLIINTDYGFIAHNRQERRHSPVLTPAERLPGIYWANLFGRPYIEFFGREKLLSTPCYEVREITGDLILLLSAESPNAKEMIDDDEVVNQIKRYLNQNAFAGPNFPDESCAVPKFDFNEVRGARDTGEEMSPGEELARLQSDLHAKGYKLIDEKDGRLFFRGADNSVVLVDKAKAEISLDLTGAGEYLTRSQNKLKNLR
jgi:hypothetical protein